MKLVDNVTSELISAVRDTTKHMSTFPVLREEIDRVVRTGLNDWDSQRWRSWASDIFENINVNLCPAHI